MESGDWQSPWSCFTTSNLLLPPPTRPWLLQSLYSVLGGWESTYFFALSGFLIAGILYSRTAKNYFSPFYARRVLGIFPLYYSVLTVVLIAAVLIHTRPTSLSPIRSSTTFTS